MTDNPPYRNPLLDILNQQNPMVDPNANERYGMIFDKLLALQQGVRIEIANLNEIIHLLSRIRVTCPTSHCTSPSTPYEKRNFKPTNCKVVNGLDPNCLKMARTFPIQLDMAMGENSSNPKQILENFRTLLLQRYKELEQERQQTNLMIQAVLQGIALR